MNCSFLTKFNYYCDKILPYDKASLGHVGLTPAYASIRVENPTHTEFSLGIVGKGDFEEPNSNGAKFLTFKGQVYLLLYL